MLGLIPSQIIFQSARLPLHRTLFATARRENRVYPCDCSRKDVLESLQQFERAPHEPVPEYSGHCRNRSTGDSFKPVETLAWRWRSTDESGRHDAILARTDASGENFVPGYHWACAVDDAHGDYSILVRAWDLAPVERIQSEIRRYLTGSSDAEGARVFHTSLVVREDGGRLEKRTKGVTLDEIIDAGISAAELTKRFDESFDQSLALRVMDSAPPVGEESRKISVNQFLRI